MNRTLFRSSGTRKMLTNVLNMCAPAWRICRSLESSCKPTGEPTILRAPLTTSAARRSGPRIQRRASDVERLRSAAGASAAAAAASAPAALRRALRRALAFFAFSRLTNFFLGLGNSNASPLSVLRGAAGLGDLLVGRLAVPAGDDRQLLRQIARCRGSSPAACRPGPGRPRSARPRRRSRRRRTARGPTGSRCGTGARSRRC